MLSIKQGGIKYHFLSLWYDSTWNWIPVFLTIGEHSTCVYFAEAKTLFVFSTSHAAKTMHGKIRMAEQQQKTESNLCITNN